MTTFEINLPTDPLRESTTRDEDRLTEHRANHTENSLPIRHMVRPLHIVTHLPSILMRNLLAFSFKHKETDSGQGLIKFSQLVKSQTFSVSNRDRNYLLESKGGLCYVGACGCGCMHMCVHG